MHEDLHAYYWRHGCDGITAAMVSLNRSSSCAARAHCPCEPNAPHWEGRGSGRGRCPLRRRWKLQRPVERGTGAVKTESARTRLHIFAHTHTFTHTHTSEETHHQHRGGVSESVTQGSPSRGGVSDSGVSLGPLFGLLLFQTERNPRPPPLRASALSRCPTCGVRAHGSFLALVTRRGGGYP